MQRRQHVNSGFVTLGDRSGRIVIDKTRGAEILRDQESGVDIAVKDGWRREAARA